MCIQGYDQILFRGSCFFVVAVVFFSFPVQMSTWLELIFGRYFFMPVVLHTVIFFSAQTVNIRLLKILKIIIC